METYAAFAKGGDQSVELTNSYQDILTLTFTAPKVGYAVLTGCGQLTLTNMSSNPVWAWAGIGVGPNSAMSGNETDEAGASIELPSAEGGGKSYRYPFSVTTVLPVKRGVNHFYLVGIRDPNTMASNWYANGLKLTAILVDIVKGIRKDYAN